MSKMLFILLFISLLEYGQTEMFAEPRANYFLNMPRTLMLNKEYKFFFHTTSSISRIEINTTEPISQITVEQASTIIQGQVGAVRYEIPFDNIPGRFIHLTVTIESCDTNETDIFNCVPSNKRRIYQKVQIQVVKNNFIILGETDKFSYIRGETVRFRFLAVHSITLKRMSRDAGSQKYSIRKHGDTFQLTNKTNSDNSAFTTITITNGENRVISEWRNLSWNAALNLTYRLPTNAQPGRWKIRALYDGQARSQKFFVTDEQKPFKVIIHAPTVILVNEYEIAYTVCVTDRQGKGIPGGMNTSLCLLHQRSESCFDQHVRMIGEKSCYKLYVNLFFKLKIRKHYYMGARTAVVRATVITDGHEKITQETRGSNIFVTRFSIHFVSNDYYIQGMGYKVRVVALNHNGSPRIKAKIKIVGLLSAITDPNKNLTEAKSGFSKTITTNSYGEGQMNIPPIKDNRTILLMAEDDSPEEVGIEGEAMMENSRAYMEVRPLFPSQPFLDVTSVNVESLKECNARVSLELLSNKPLKFRTIFVQSMARGELVSLLKFDSLEGSAECEDRDDNFGHYRCDKEEKGIHFIKCDPGWSGDNCVNPLCNHSCNNGMCFKPNQCACENYWTGEFCDKCIPDSACQNGYCITAKECICHTGWYGYACHKTIIELNEDENTIVNTPRDSIVMIHNLGRSVPPLKKSYSLKVEQESQRATVFTRNISFDLDRSLTPEASFLIYFFETSNNNSRVIIQSVKLEDIVERSCVASENASTVFDADKELAYYTNQNLTVTINSKRDIEKCALQITDQELGEGLGISVERVIHNMRTVYNKMSDIAAQQYLDEKNKSCDSTNNQSPTVSDINSAAQLTNNGMYLLTEAELPTENCRDDHTFKTNCSLNETDDCDQTDDDISEEFKISELHRQVWKFAVFDSAYNLTTPPDASSWQVRLFCMTDQGLWMPPTLRMDITTAFDTDILSPSRVKVGEVLDIRVKVKARLLGCHQLVISIDSLLRIIGPREMRTCICNGDDRTAIFEAEAVTQGFAYAIAKVNTEQPNICGNVTRVQYITDYKKKLLFIDYEGIRENLTISDAVCLEQNKETKIKLQVNLPPEAIKTSTMSVAVVTGDLMAPILTDFDRLTRISPCCALDSLFSLSVSVAAVEYLSHTKSHQHDQLSKKAINILEKGYHKLLTYRLKGKGFSNDSKLQKLADIKLSASIFQLLHKMQAYTQVVDRTILNGIIQYMERKQQKNGCFLSHYQADTNDEIALTSHIIVSLRNDTKSHEMLSKGVVCLMNLLQEVAATQLPNYSLVLLTQALSVIGGQDAVAGRLRQILTRRAVRTPTMTYWSDEPDTTPPTSLQIEITAIAYLTLVNYHEEAESLRIIRWLINQRNTQGNSNSYGNILCIQALSHFAKMTSHKRIHLQVSLFNNKQFVKRVSVDNKKSIEYMDVTAEGEPTSTNDNVTWRVKGEGCVHLQFTSMFHSKHSQNISTYELKALFIRHPHNCGRGALMICFTVLNKKVSFIAIIVQSVSGWKMESTSKSFGKYYASIGYRSMYTENDVTYIYFYNGKSQNSNKRNCFFVYFKLINRIRSTRPGYIKLVTLDRGHSTKYEATYNPFPCSSDKKSSQRCPKSFFSTTTDSNDETQIGQSLCSFKTLLFIRRVSDSVNSIYLYKENQLWGWNTTSIGTIRSECYDQSKRDNLMFLSNATKSRSEMETPDDDFFMIDPFQFVKLTNTNLAGCSSLKDFHDLLKAELVSSDSQQCPKCVTNFSTRYFNENHFCKATSRILTVQVSDSALVADNRPILLTPGCSCEVLNKNDTVILLIDSDDSRMRSEESLVLNNHYIITNWTTFNRYKQLCQN